MSDQIAIRYVRWFQGWKPGQEGVAERRLADALIAKGDAVHAKRWAELRHAAISTPCHQVLAADLCGRRMAESFLERVIKDPKVQACGKWLCLERPEFRKIFTEGLYRLRDRIWPVVLDAEELIKIFSSTVTIGSWGTTLDLAGGADVDETGPIHHAARAIADQHNAFFDLFRTRTRQLIAIGIYSGEQKEIPSATWSLANKWLDLKSGGLFDKGDNDTGFFRMPWEAVEVLPMRTKIANPPAAAAANKPKDSESAPSGPRRRRPIQSRVEDQMIAEIKQGRLTREGLEDMLQKEMLNRFNALSRDTCCQGSQGCVGENVARQITTNDKYRHDR